MKSPDDPKSKRFDDVNEVKEPKIYDAERVSPQLQRIMQSLRIQLLSLDEDGRLRFACRRNPPEEMYDYDADLRAAPNELIDRAMRLAASLKAFMPPLQAKNIQQQAMVADETLRYLCHNFYSKEEGVYNTFPMPVYFPRINVEPEDFEDDEQIQRIYLQCCKTAIGTLASLYSERHKARMVTVDVPLRDLKVAPEVARASLQRNGFALHLPLCYSGLERAASVKHAESLEPYMLTPADPYAVLVSALENHDMFNGMDTFGQQFYGTKKKLHLKANWGSINTELIIEKPNVMISPSISSIGLIFQPEGKLPVSGDLP